MDMIQSLRIHYRQRALLYAIANGERIRLHVGSGNVPRPGYIHLDNDPCAPSIDLLYSTPGRIGLPAACVEQVVVDGMIDAMAAADVEALFRELDRVLMPGARITVWTEKAGMIQGLLRAAGMPGVSIVKGLAKRSARETVVEALGSGSAAGDDVRGCSAGWWTICLGVTARWRRATAAAAARLKRIALLPGLALLPPGVRRQQAGGEEARVPDDPRRLLVFNIAGIGDFARMVPFLRELKGRFPGAGITVVYNTCTIKDVGLWREYYDEALGLATAHDFDKRFSREQAAPRSVYTEYGSLVRQLRRRRFDMAWVFGMNEATGNLGTLLVYLAGAGCRIGVHLGGFRELLHYHVTLQDPNPSPYDFYSKGMQPLGGEVQSTDSTIRVPAEAALWAEDYLGRLGISADCRRVVIHPGSGGRVNSRRWPLDKFARLADRIDKDYRLPVILTGSAQETDLVRDLAQQMNCLPAVVAGATDLRQFAGLLSMADLLITNDTSALHLANAVGTTRIVGIFGPTHHSNVIPADERIVPVQSRLPCSPCAGPDGNDPDTKCTRSLTEECLIAISVDDVWAAVQSCLEELKVSPACDRGSQFSGD